MQIKNEDIKAILDFDSKKHIYLKVVGSGESQHLEASKISWLGRILMHLGLSSASLNRVASYLARLQPFDIALVANSHSRTAEERDRVYSKIVYLKDKLYDLSNYNGLLNKASKVFLDTEKKSSNRTWD